MTLTRNARPASEELADAVRWYEERRRGLDPGVLLPGEWLYFVIVGYDGEDEGDYGVDSSSTPRPEVVGVGVCDRPSTAPSTCE